MPPTATSRTPASMLRAPADAGRELAELVLPARGRLRVRSVR